MIEKSGWRENEPNRKTIIFEAEWNGEGDIPADSLLIRNNGECPENVVKRIRAHYQKLKEAIAEGKHLNTHFADHKKWADVWQKAIENGFMPDFSDVEEFAGYVYLKQGATLTAPKLVKVSGYVYLKQGATLTAPKLVEVSGCVDLQQGATLTAPKLKR